MSLIHPKAGDYELRSIQIGIALMLVGWIPLAVIGGLIGGIGGALLGQIMIAPIVWLCHRWYLRQ